MTFSFEAFDVECACAYGSVKRRRGTAELAGIMAADRLQVDEETGLPVYRTKPKERYMPYILISKRK